MASENDLRWHYDLHPSLSTRSPRNALPKRIEGLIHPTHATLVRKDKDAEAEAQAGDGGEEEFLWKSRDHRKNRHVKYTPDQEKSRQGTSALVGIGHMIRIEYWNVSWWVAIAFTLGSIVWVINGFYSFLPFVDTRFAMSEAGIGWSAFVGATIFEVGSILGILEAFNRETAVNFGWGVRRAFAGAHPSTEATESKRQAFAAGDSSASDMDDTGKKRRWIWFSTDVKYWHELGFLAAFMQFWAATIFWISGFTALPSIQDAITTSTAILDVVFWTPQVVGGTGFIISSSLLMLETQRRWYKPAPSSLGWQVGLWNFIGAIGFTLCGALGYAAQASSGASYESSLSTFWGGWAFLIGSVLQWYESVNSV